MFRIKNKNNGFTLVELIIVIVILAILATIAFLSFSSQSSIVRDSVRLSDISSIKKAFEVYNIKSGVYPAPDNGKNITYSGGLLWTQGTIGDNLYRLISSNISKKVVDPITAREYIYSLTANKNEYQIKADMENSTSFLKNSNPFIDFANAGNILTTCYVKGNYNGLVIKGNTGGLINILPSPSLIVANTKNSANLVYDSDFGNGKISCDGQNYPCLSIFKSDVPVYSSGSLPSNEYDIKIMMRKLKTAYSGSNIANNNQTIQNILSSTGQAFIDIGKGFIKKSLGGGGITFTPSLFGISPTQPGTSCYNIYDSGGIVEDGTYYIDPDGVGGNPPVLAYCNMTKGGWTRFAKIIGSSDIQIGKTNTGNWNTVDSTFDMNGAKFDYLAVKKLSNSVWNEYQMNGQKVWNSSVNPINFSQKNGRYSSFYCSNRGGCKNEGCLNSAEGFCKYNAWGMGTKETWESAQNYSEGFYDGESYNSSVTWELYYR